MSNGGHVSEGAAETVIVEPASAEAIRSPSDVLRLVVAVAVLLVLLLVQWLFGDTLTRFAADLLSGLAAIPHWIVNVVIVGTRVLVVVVIGGGFVVTLLRGRWRFLFTVGAAAVIAGALAWLLDRIGPSAATDVIQVTDVLKPLNGRGFPSGPGVAAAAAIVTAAAPWVARRWRRAGWALVIGLALTRFLSGPISFDALRGVLIGWVVGAAVLVIFGGPSRRPTSASIAAGLACRRRAACSPRTRERRRARLDAVLRGGDRRTQAVREGARRGPAQRRSALSPLPLRDPAPTR